MENSVYLRLLQRRVSFQNKTAPIVDLLEQITHSVDGNSRSHLTMK
jgi:hypothetical protein